MVETPIPTRSILPLAIGKSVSSESIHRSYAYCRRVARHRAQNFYYGLMLTPKAKRAALYAIYGFMRACDDLADAGDSYRSANYQQKRANIEAFRRQMDRIICSHQLPLGADKEPSMWPAFLHVMEQYPINKAHLHAMLDGQCADLMPQQYESFEQTHGYCYKVASTVGLVCLSIWGYRGGVQTQKLAEYRGVALQLTNMLRDLVEDARRDRVYLPAEDLDRFGYDWRSLLDGRANDAFDHLMRFQIDRARSYYAKSSALESYVDRSCRPTCWTIMRIYRGLLEKIALHPRRVLSERISLSVSAKMWIAMRAVRRRFGP